MPTGYTAAIADGIDFKTFATRCARGAMGACIMQRDDDSKDPLKMDEPSDYHQKALAAARKMLVKLESTSAEDMQKRFVAEKKKRLADAWKGLEDKVELRRKYSFMLQQVRDWTPPTKNHQGMKEFMVQQITESIEWDCGGDFWTGELKNAERTTFEKWATAQFESTKHDIAYHEKHHAEEVKRTNERNEWKRQLLESLK